MASTVPKNGQCSEPRVEPVADTLGMRRWTTASDGICSCRGHSLGSRVTSHCLRSGSSTRFSTTRSGKVQLRARFLLYQPACGFNACLLRRTGRIHRPVLPGSLTSGSAGLRASDPTESNNKNICARHECAQKQTRRESSKHAK
ncbi:hypothetical protein OH76DRAFT_1003279 [Lentinus brumalis]|uniref:Uncharacterized protein n=1 Tax=Lentinus brumalis TaxID=2498619 RepID=A0A371CYG6_9APHY|nr:hypothetical protein OH76DRAFT_1003279 [Polyporus brumalis]